MRGTPLIRLFDFALVCLSGFLISQWIKSHLVETSGRDVRMDVFFLGVSISILILRITDEIKQWLQRNLENTREIVWVSWSPDTDSNNLTGEPWFQMNSIEMEETLFPQRMSVQVEDLREFGGGERS